MRHAERALPLTALVIAGLASSAFAADLVSKGSPQASSPGLVTGAVSASGALAPAGAQWSEMPADIGGNAMALAGVAAHPEAPFASFRAADTFVVPPGARWSVTSVTVYAYQPGAGASPFAAGTIRLWRGRPGAPGSTILAGDTTTNRIASVSAFSAYRIFSTVGLSPGAGGDLSRSLWRIDLSVPLVTLEPGVYWIDVGLQPTQTGAQAFLATVKPSRTESPAEGAAQLRPVAGGASWVTLGESRILPINTLEPVGLAFIVRGTSAPRCISFTDLSGLIQAYGSSVTSPNWNPLYDFNGDGGVRGEDLAYLISMYGVSCN